mgnify:FL=1
MDTKTIEMIKENMNHDTFLGPLATKNKDAYRVKPEPEDIRPPYFHDIDRIIYSLAYTRYINKTQVFSDTLNDNITRRSTHVQLVSKIARTIGRALRLNEDLIEAASLGHDIGHTPFGHAGEAILNRISLRVGEGYFNHNIQSVRKLEFLENKGSGLNLTVQVIDAIMCHNGELELSCYKPVFKTKEEVFQEYYRTYQDKDANTSLIPMTLEGCVVRISDIISYLGRDIEDAIRLNFLKRSELPKDIIQITGLTNKEIVNYFINDIIKNSINKDYIAMSPEAFRCLSNLKKFNYEHIYSKVNSSKTLDKWEEMFNKVFKSSLSDLKMHNETSHIYIYFYKYMNEDYKKNTSLERVVIDYIAGMTDRFLKREYEKLN